MAETIEVKVRGGVLIAEKLTDPENPGIALVYKPEGADFGIDLCIVENQNEEIRHVDDPDMEVSDKDLIMYTFENVATEEWQQRIEIPDSAIRELLESL